MPESKVFHEDCMEGMKRFPDGFFDLACVDPPYGINAFQGTNRASRKMFAGKTENWDAEIPSKEYFEELKRVSKNQIIWGGNYFLEHLGNTRAFIIWDKLNPDRCFADCEFAWSSFDQVARIIKLRPQSVNEKDGGKIHPTQKSTALYHWVFKNYAQPGQRILDTHLGSGSSRIVAFHLNLDFYGFEIDEAYFTEQEIRFNRETALPLFTNIETLQTKLL
jgi:site-specific DNA-methyltransferase (adenine-specific)